MKKLLLLGAFLFLFPFAAQAENEGICVTYSDLQFTSTTTIANFVIHEDCEVLITYASYIAPGPTFGLPQTLLDYETDVYDEGEYSVTLDLAPCFYQVDLVFGNVIEVLTENNLYGDKKIVWQNGGHECEVVPPPVPNPPPPTPTPPPSSGGGPLPCGPDNCGQNPPPPAPIPTPTPTPTPPVPTPQPPPVLPVTGIATWALGIMILLMAIIGIIFISKEPKDPI